MIFMFVVRRTINIIQEDCRFVNNDLKLFYCNKL